MVWLVPLGRSICQKAMQLCCGPVSSCPAWAPQVIVPTQPFLWPHGEAEWWLKLASFFSCYSARLFLIHMDGWDWRKRPEAGPLPPQHQFQNWFASYAVKSKKASLSLSLQSQVFKLHFESPLNAQNSPSKPHIWWHHKCKILSSTYSSCQDGTSPGENF